jgi:hypothetical protein
MSGGENSKLDGFQSSSCREERGTMEKGIARLRSNKNGAQSFIARRLNSETLTIS